MKRMAYLLATTAFVVSVVNGCEVNPFSPPDEPLSSGEASSSNSSSGSGISSSSTSGGGSGSVSSSSGMAGSGGMGGGTGGTAGAGGGCVCTDDNNVCTDDAMGSCPNGDEAACHTPKLAAQCPMGVCNDKAECVDCLTCADAACTDRCNGVACGVAGDCKSGNCEQATCCNAACQGPCKACDRPGVQGACTRMPFGLQVNGCNMGMLCDNAGACVPQTKAALGALCNNSPTCQNGLCRREYCQSANGEPCVEDLECDSNLCDPVSKTCKACTGAGAGGCAAGSMCMMPAGRCQVFLGQPAGTDAECVTGTVIQFLCSLPSGAACNAHHDCVGRNCVGGVCTAQCSTAADCADGGPCSVNGVCGMMPGEYCVVNEQCKSGNCSGFPRKCQ